MKKLLIPLAFAGIAVGCSGDGPTVPLDAAPALHLVSDGPLPYTLTSDCSQSVLVDPGRTHFANGNMIIQGRIFDCPIVAGDLGGVVRVTWRNAVFGPGPEGGHFAGTTAVLVDSYFGRTDLEGTFEGPFSASRADILFGESQGQRTGTGDFRGLVMHFVFSMDPPASGRTVGNGTIVGR
jgi:hypothetical protein